MTTEITPAIDSAADVVRQHWGPFQAPEMAAEVVSAAVDVERIGRHIADDLYTRDSRQILDKRPDETYRDHADRVGRWAAETARASILGES